MRIIAGNRRGKKLFTPADDSIRPTGDRVRAALFSILISQQWIRRVEPLPIGARVLDLACGTGALACEALSRGAATATLYDNNATALALAKQNFTAIGAISQAIIAFADLTHLPQTSQTFDLIFCDPPYQKGLGEIALQQLLAGQYLHYDSLIVIETAAAESLVMSDKYRLFDSRRYGAARLWFIGINS